MVGALQGLLRACSVGSSCKESELMSASLTMDRWWELSR